ncbi:hypothetical protein AB0M28_33560 [Streptomyces sp. NPDC051940]|uniref:hypothetical protein n=1 Tax=Streptomyces sp. NPDC051940 TaxID=3155675 RepID=UPI00341DE27C
MSGSPKYTTVSYDPAREAARRAALEAERRRRAEERARRAREQAARRAALRAEQARKNAELAARRAEQDRAHAAGVRAEQGRAAARRMDAVARLLTDARRAAPDDEHLGALQEQLTALRSRTPGQELDAAVEELRGRVVLAAPKAGAARTADPGPLLDALAERLAAAGPDGAALDDTGHRRCEALLTELRDAAATGQRVRFEALLGTAEYEVDRHLATVADAVAARAAEQRRTAEREAAEAAERERAAAVEQARTDALAETADRFDALHEAVRAAVSDAAGFSDDELAERLAGPLAQAERALAEGDPDTARTAVAELERVLPEAERRLDELLLAHERRIAVARAVQDAMTGEGLSFTGGDEFGNRVLLRFERPGGAVYETAVGSDEEGTPMLVYRIEGEPDISAAASAEGGAVCDTTEELLERVHGAMGRDGFTPGELHWDGKPPARGRRRRPDEGVGRTR